MVKLNSTVHKTNSTVHGEINSTACYLVSRSPSTTIKCKMPEEVWSDTLVEYFRLRIFDCPVYAHVNDEPRAKKCISFGICI